MDNTTANGQVATANATKKVNYTDAQTEQLIELYIASGKDSSKESLEKIGKEINRSLHSVRSKLQVEKVYVPLNKTATKTNPNKMDKNQIVGKVEALLGVDSDALESFVKANKQHLNTLLDALQSHESEES